MRVAVGILVAATLAIPAKGQSSSPAHPPLPYESLGACPFECCTYRTWTVEADTDILAERKDSASASFLVRRGQRVEGVTGVVVTASLGRAVVRRTSTIGTGPRAITVQPGEAVFVLHYVGEGYWKVGVRGRVVDDQLPHKDTGCVNALLEPVECAIQITEQPKAVWWAKIRSRGREGWTRQPDHFGNIDACG